MADPALAGFVERLMRDDIVASLPPTPDLDFDYIASILRRFRNPAIARHQLSQIAWDGSQKLPVRLLGTVADTLATGRPVDRLAIPVAAWTVFAARRAAAPSRWSIRWPGAIAASPQRRPSGRRTSSRHESRLPVLARRRCALSRAVSTAHRALAEARLAESLAR